MTEIESWVVNTSNHGKQKEFRSLLGENTCFTIIDLKEPSADQITVIRYKASQFDGTIVDDTSLDIKGTDIGADIRWRLEELDNFIGLPALFQCYLGINVGGEVKIFYGEVKGKIVDPQGNGFGFNNYFLPDGAALTLGQQVLDQHNARYHAVQKLLTDQHSFILKPLTKWNGAFQTQN